jgi:hypothetical protein
MEKISKGMIRGTTTEICSKNADKKKSISLLKQGFSSTSISLQCQYGMQIELGSIKD